MAAALAVMYREQGAWGGPARPGPDNPQPATTTGDIVIRMNDLSDPLSNKKQTALFGPNLGIISGGPKWTEANQKKVVADQLTPEIVKSWIAKSKEATYPTTTLQALVNLKRPSLRLSPLASSEDAESAGSAHTNPEHLHGLEFEYDCDAPKCGLSIHALLDPNHPEAENSIPAACGLSKTLLFEQTVDGGFDRILKLEEGAVLELGKLERKPIPPPSEQGAPSGTAGATAVTASTTTVNSAAPATTVDAPTAPQPTAEETTRRKRRFTPFHFRKRVQGRAVMGPALTVVDAEPAPVPAAAAAVATSSESSKLPEKPTEGDGVKIIIRLAALDEHGVDLGSVNEQMTYLHIVRFGAKPESENPGDDARPWVVQVVKREATIGLHTFHLHEIYGLSSSSSSSPPPPSPPAHSYPPTERAPSMSGSAPECLVCLSSPREVVLLPCRHLVACKECAMNMVEFGAGGNIVQAEGEEAAAAAAPATAAVPPVIPGQAEMNAMPPPPGSIILPSMLTLPPPPPPPPVAQRRKRRPKGWFCPVCRQPYTSLLRLTTVPPECLSKENLGADKVESEDSTPGATGTGTGAGAGGAGEQAPAGAAAATRSGGLPGFLRSLSGRAGGNASGGAAEPDLERGVVGA